MDYHSVTQVINKWTSHALVTPAVNGYYLCHPSFIQAESTCYFGYYKGTITVNCVYYNHYIFICNSKEYFHLNALHNKPGNHYHDLKVTQVMN